MEGVGQVNWRRVPTIRRILLVDKEMVVKVKMAAAFGFLAFVASASGSPVGFFVLLSLPFIGWGWHRVHTIRRTFIEGVTVPGRITGVTLAGRLGYFVAYEYSFNDKRVQRRFATVNFKRVWDLDVDSDVEVLVHPDCPDSGLLRDLFRKTTLRENLKTMWSVGKFRWQ